MNNIKIPYYYYRVLNDFSLLIKKNHKETIKYILNNFIPSESLWVKDRYGHLSSKEYTIPNPGIKIDVFFLTLESLPRNIRPLTDSYYLKDYRFLHDQKELIGIEACGIKIYDYQIVTSREKNIFPHVSHFFKNMTLEEYRIYNQFNSQFYRLINEPSVFQMPDTDDYNIAIDVGCYVGYKVFALSFNKKKFTRPVIGFEMDEENFNIFNINIHINKLQNIIKSHKVGLSDNIKKSIMYTRQKKTMAHSLEKFDQLSEANSKIGLNSSGQVIETQLLDNYTKKYKKISALHISVNGHEHQVVNGSINTIKKTSKIRVACPYNLNGIPVRELVSKKFMEIGYKNYKYHGGAIVIEENIFFKFLIRKILKKIKFLLKKYLL